MAFAAAEAAGVRRLVIGAGQLTKERSSGTPGSWAASRSGLLINGEIASRDISPSCWSGLFRALHSRKPRSPGVDKEMQDKNRQFRFLLVRIGHNNERVFHRPSPLMLPGRYSLSCQLGKRDPHNGTMGPGVEPVPP